MRAVLCPLTADPYICPVPANGCNVLIKDEICPVCRRKTDPVTDVIDEAIETAWKHKCAVKQIDATTRLDRYGSVGAFLKYKI